MDEIIHFAVMAPTDFCITMFLNRLAQRSGFYIMSQQLVIQEKASALAVPGQQGKRPQIMVLHICQIPLNRFEEWTGKTYKETEIYYSQDFPIEAAL